MDQSLKRILAKKKAKKKVKKKAKKKAKKKTKKKPVFKDLEQINVNDSPGGFDDNELFKKAYIAVENILVQANLQNDQEKQHKALSSLLTYMRAKALNTNAIIEIIARANTQQLKLIEASLKKQGILEDIKKGKATLTDVYQLPVLKNKGVKT